VESACITSFLRSTAADRAPLAERVSVGVDSTGSALDRDNRPEILRLRGKR